MIYVFLRECGCPCYDLYEGPELDLADLKRRFEEEVFGVRPYEAVKADPGEEGSFDRALAVNKKWHADRKTAIRNARAHGVRTTFQEWLRARYGLTKVLYQEVEAE